MPLLTSHIIIDAAAESVWEVVAHRFDRIGDWATAIPSSTATAEPSAVGAPVAGRVCHTGLRQAPEVTETVMAYDNTDRTLTYQATAGLPAFIALARNQWQVTALDDGRTQVTFAAHVEVRGLLGRLAWWVLLLQVRYTGRHLLADLKHYVERGTPSARKQRKARTAGPA
jgi:Polyketide cyclase / dehydrase and lipid transport